MVCIRPPLALNPWRRETRLGARDGMLSHNALGIINGFIEKFPFVFVLRPVVGIRLQEAETRYSVFFSLAPRACDWSPYKPQLQLSVLVNQRIGPPASGLH